ncbi:MAG TPA: hypothetical protein VNW92_00200 [Polyangiaceae bacterium]|jgi:hypothetical protein|nr:hypothetical protein [Polyangiaceae bacterium]
MGGSGGLPSPGAGLTAAGVGGSLSGSAGRGLRKFRGAAGSSSQGGSEATIAIGAWAESRHDGTAYMFAPSGGVWSERGTLDATMARGPTYKSPSPNGFGYALALASSALIVGAPFEGQPIAATPHGTSYAFE